MEKAEKRSLLHSTSACGKKKGSISSHLPEQAFALGLSRRKNWGQGERYV
jgi:hypothetical protein